MTRWMFWGALAALLAGALRHFPADPEGRARVVCEPLHWLLRAANEVSTSMDGRGRVGGWREPWHEDLHRACLRVGERIFLAFEDP